MRTEDLIDQLAARVPRAPRHAALRRLGAGVGCGAVVALAGLLFTLGVRPDIAQASGTAPFWMKWAFTLALAAPAFLMVRQLARPEGRVGPAAWLALGLPVVLVGMMGLGELVGAPASLRDEIWLGRTAIQCPTAILALAVPIFAGLAWAFRSMAPTRLALAGGAAGLLAGSAAAAVYALTCPEQTAAFMATWYTAGIGAAGLLGALIGPRLLRW